jgi:hypothetical protein
MATKTPVMWCLFWCGRAGYQVDRCLEVGIEVLVVTVNVTLSFMGMRLSPARWSQWRVGHADVLSAQLLSHEAPQNRQRA